MTFSFAIPNAKVKFSPERLGSSWFTNKLDRYAVSVTHGEQAVEVLRATEENASVTRQAETVEDILSREKNELAFERQRLLSSPFLFLNRKAQRRLAEVERQLDDIEAQLYEFKGTRFLIKHFIDFAKESRDAIEECRHLLGLN